MIDPVVYWGVVIGIIVIGGSWIGNRMYKDYEKGHSRTARKLPIYGRMSYLLVNKYMWYPINNHEWNIMITKLVLFFLLIIGYYTGWFWIMMLFAILLLLGRWEWLDEDGC